MARSAAGGLRLPLHIIPSGENARTRTHTHARTRPRHVRDFLLFCCWSSHFSPSYFPGGNIFFLARQRIDIDGAFSLSLYVGTGANKECANRKDDDGGSDRTKANSLSGIMKKGAAISSVKLGRGNVVRIKRDSHVPLCFISKSKRHITRLALWLYPTCSSDPHAQITCTQCMLSEWCQSRA